MSIFKSTTVKGKGKPPHISSLSHSHREAPRCPMAWEDLLDTSRSPGGMLPPIQQSGTVPSLSGQSQHTILYATIFVVGSNGLVYGTSAGNKTPFVGVYTTQLASRCRLLKPQRGTAFHVWLRAENKKKTKHTQQLASHWYQSCPALPCAKTKKLWHLPAHLLASPNPILEWGARMNVWLWQYPTICHL